MILEATHRERLDHFLARHLAEHSRSKLQKMITEGLVLVEGIPASKTGLELRPGWRIELPQPEETPIHNLTPIAIDLNIVYEDDDIIVVDKPRGLATHPAKSLKGASLVNALLALSLDLSTGSDPFRPGIVHRLDKDTTGLIVVAKHDSSHRELSEQIQKREVDRIYVARILGIPLEDEFTVDAAIGRDPINATRMAVRRTGKRARTHVQVIKTKGNETMIACKLDTGRTHQIRVHLQACHTPVVGDPIYGQKQDGRPLQLHAALLRIRHPRTQEPMTFFQRPPDDFTDYDEINREDVDLWS